MKIIEQNTQISEFILQWNAHPSIIVPIWEELDLHPINNRISFLFIRIKDTDYILPYTHIDCKSIQLDLSVSTSRKWVWGKKQLLHSNIRLNNTIDIQSHIFYTTNSQLELDINNFMFIQHYHRLRIHNGLGKIAPIVKWGECISTFLDTHKIETYLSQSDLYDMDWLHNQYIPLMYEIERYGICVDSAKFFEKWPKYIRHIVGGRVYTEYNINTSTSRPSNRFGGINFSALNKSDGTRDIFTPPKDSIFLQVDYDAYHLRIIGKLLNVELPETSVHKWLSDIYGVDYTEGKSITFHLIYNDIPDELAEIPYFAKLREYISELWSRTVADGYITTKYRKIPLKWIESPNPHKVFNYLIQNTETVINVEKIKKLLPILHMNNIELNLYVYDSMLFSIPLEIDMNVLLNIKNIIQYNGYPIKADWGIDYGKF